MGPRQPLVGSARTYYVILMVVDVSQPVRVLVLGATGVFGSRLCERLLQLPSLNLTVASRSAEKAERLAARLQTTTPDSTVIGRAVRIGKDLDQSLELLRPQIVVHAAGPFQGQNYGVAESSLAAGAHYIDLADSTTFVTGFERLDKRARAAGRLAITGASSVPGLSSTVVDSLAGQFQSLDMIDIGISPGNRAPRGHAVVEAILSYAGQPIPAWRNGGHARAFGWQGLRRRSLRGLGPRWLCDCDVPDLLLFPRRYRANHVRFGAGLELSVLHLGLWGLAGLCRVGLLPNLRRFTALLRYAAVWFEGFGTDRGGMYVRVKGTDLNGQLVTRTWSLVAERGHGPFVPILPATILVRKLANGSLARIGAMPCLGLFTLQDFRDEASDLKITMTDG